MAVAGEPLPLLDAEAEEFLFNRNDSVWHERALLWRSGDRWEVITPAVPDFELLPPRIGRPRCIQLCEYTFTDRNGDQWFCCRPCCLSHGHAGLCRCLRCARNRVPPGGLVTVFPLVKEANGIEVGADLIVGRRAASRRVTGETGALAPPGAAPAFPVLPSRPSKGDGWKEKLRIGDGAPEGSALVLAETVDDILQVGAEVMLDAAQGYQVDATNALHNVVGRWSRCELMKVVDIPGSVEEVLVRYGRASSNKSDVVVPKASVVTPVSSEVRMIIDVRRANRMFRTPPGVDLCTAEGVSRTEGGLPKSPNSKRCLRSCDSCRMALCMDDHGHQDEFHFCMSCLINGAADHLGMDGHGHQDEFHFCMSCRIDGTADHLAEVESTNHGNCTQPICQHCGQPGGHSRLLTLMSARCGRRIHRVCSLEHYSSCNECQGVNQAGSRRVWNDRELIDGRRMPFAPGESSGAAEAGAEALGEDGLPRGGKGGKAGGKRARAKARALAAPGGT